MKSKYNPSAYFPLFGNDFFQAVEGYPDSVGMAYLHALWHYWHHCHCEGLPDDDDYLCRICHCLISDWVRTKGVLFDNDKFFRLKDGKWHQGRAFQEHQRSTEIYVNRLKSISNARKHNRNVVSDTRPDTRPDTRTENNPTETNTGLASHSSPSPSSVQVHPPTPLKGGGVGVLSPVMTRLNALFKRRESTRWSDRERKTLKRLEPIPEEDLKLVEGYYLADHPPDKDYRRRDLQTLLNNWTGELDRARDFAAKPDRNRFHSPERIRARISDIIAQLGREFDPTKGHKLEVELHELQSRLSLSQ